MPLLVYTLLRVLLVVAAGGLLYLLGMRGALLVIAAVLVGAMLSYAVLGGPRRRAAERLQTIAERDPRPATPDADARAEDAELDADDARGDRNLGDASAPTSARPPSAEGERDAERDPEK